MNVQQGPKQPPTPPCPACDHPMGDHSVYIPPLRPRPTWCHACDTHCGHQPADGDLQDQGEAARQAAGIDGTAGDAQDITHTFVLDQATGGCLLCGLAPGYRKHTA